jgi:hypothetical protein
MASKFLRSLFRTRYRVKDILRRVDDIKSSLDRQMASVCDNSQEICVLKQKLGQAETFRNGMIRRVTPWNRFINLQVYIAEHCNVNCYGCDVYSPIAEKTLLSLESFTRDFEKLSFLTNGKIDVIRLMGGEPLLHPDILEFLRVARYYFPDPQNKILIFTNGILLLKMNDELYAACKKHNIGIQMTRYPNLDYAAIEARISSFDLQYNYAWNETTVHKSWRGPIYLRPPKTANPALNFITCAAANSACVSLREGKLFTCHRPAFIHHFNKYFGKNIEVTKSDYIDIHSATSLEEILVFIAKPIPFCRYCNLAGGSVLDGWYKSKRNINE